jgi:hypothetical protein
MKLQSLIERYIAYHQALGESFKTNAIVLRAFGRAIGARADIAATDQSDSSQSKVSDQCCTASLMPGFSAIFPEICLPVPN